MCALGPSLRLDAFRQGWAAQVPGTALELRAVLLPAVSGVVDPVGQGAARVVSYALWRVSVLDGAELESWTLSVEGSLYTCRAWVVRRDEQAFDAAERVVEVRSTAAELYALLGRLAARVRAYVATPLRDGA